mgnify:CR=1 FL=1
MKVGDLVKVYTPNPYQPQIGLIIKTDSICDGKEIIPPMIEVVNAAGASKKVSADDLLVINEAG